MTPSREERRGFPRLRQPFALSVQDPCEAFAYGTALANLRTTDIGAGGLHFKVFEPFPFALGDELSFRILIPTDADRDTQGSESCEREFVPSVLGPAVRGHGSVVRIDPLSVEGVRGWGVALQFAGTLDVDCEHDLTACLRVS